MLNGPALLRVFLVVIAAAVLTAVVQHYWIFDNTVAEPSAAATRPAAQSALVHRPSPAPPRPSAQPAPAPLAAARATPAPIGPPPAPDPDPVTPPVSRDSAVAMGPQPLVPEPAPSRPVPAPRPTPPTAAAPQPETAEQEVAAAEATDGRAIDLVDLNGGSLSELNELKGGGAIGRAIIQRRPYASIDQLLSKRVLSRAIYQRIKNQVTVR